jgi:hypothetical protein
MEAYYDHGYDDENEDKIQQFQKNLGSFKTNPNGNYKVELMFKGIKWKIEIKNLDTERYKILARSNVKVDPDELENLKRYLIAEGFEHEARQHNLFW